MTPLGIGMGMGLGLGTPPLSAGGGGVDEGLAGEFFLENFNDEPTAYTDTTDLLVTGSGRHWGFNGVDTGAAIVLATTGGLSSFGFNLAKCMEYQYGDGDSVGGPTACNNYSVTRSSTIPDLSTKTEVWLDAFIKFPTAWRTAPDPGWSCAGAGDHKTWEVQESGGNRFDVRVGFNATAFNCHDPTNGDFLVEYSPGNLVNVITSGVFWDNTWHRLRMHISKASGGAGTGRFQVWWDDYHMRDVTHSWNNNFGQITWGANRNHWVNGAGIAWRIGLYRMWDQNPGWSGGDTPPPPA